MSTAPRRLASGANRAGAISGRMTSRVVTLLEGRGVDVPALFRRHRLDRATLVDPAARIPYAIADRLIEAAAEALGAPGLGLAIAPIVDLDTYDAAGMLLCAAADLRDGLARAFAYQRVWGDGERFTLDAESSGLTVRFTHAGPSRLAAAVCGELALLEILGAARALVDPGARPLAVRFAHAPLGDVGPLTVAFGVAPDFDATANEIVFDDALSRAPIVAPIEIFRLAFDRQARAALDVLAPTASTADRVRAAFGGGPEWIDRSIDDVARSLHTSARSLQRKLREEGTTFARLVDDVRRARVEVLLARGASAKEIAYVVGFGDPGALSRARARWRADAGRG